VARTDGIFAEGLSQDLALLVDYQPRFDTVGKSTPEFIVSRLVADSADRSERAGYETLARAVGLGRPSSARSRTPSGPRVAGCYRLRQRLGAGPRGRRMPVEFSVVASLVAVVALLAVSAFFCTEIALFSLTPERLDTLAASDARGPGLQRLREDPHRLLVTILVGNNVVNIATSSILTVLLVTYLPPELAVVGTTLVATTLVLVCGEILPKSWGWRTPNPGRSRQRDP